MGLIVVFFIQNIEKKDEIKDNENFYFDLTKETVEIPEDYKKRIKFYTGHDWDVWGLTRMSKTKNGTNAIRLTMYTIPSRF